MTDKKQKQRKTSSSNQTWTVRGVSHETREAAKKAARRSGQTLGQWLDAQIRLAASQKLTEGALVPERGEDTLKQVLARLEALEAKNQEAPPRWWWQRFFGGG